MPRVLPGGSSQTELGVTLTKAVLRLAGGEAFADAIADLTGIGRKTIKRLAKDALARVENVRSVEYAGISGTDRRWAEALLQSVYRRLAESPHSDISKEALVGAQSLAAWAMGAGLTDADRLELERIDEGAREYFSLISLSMAHLVTAWYRSDPVASRSSTAAALGEVLASTRQLVSAFAQANQPDERTQSPRETLETLTRAAHDKLPRVPEYYPHRFRNDELATELRVCRLDEDSFYRFEGLGLYWDGSLFGDELALSTDDLAPGTITVLVGNPGSGKSTLAKGLVMSQSTEGDFAAFCRLEDFARHCSAHAVAPVDAVLLSFADAADVSLSLKEVAIAGAYLKAGGRGGLIVLDGLDELATAEQYVNARRSAFDLSRLGYTIVVTTRAAGYTSAWAEAAQHFALLPLSDDARDRFASAWFESTGDSTARARYEAAKSEDLLYSALSSPLLLGFVCTLSHHEAVPPTRAAIFSRFIDHFLRGPWRAPEAQRVDRELVGLIKSHAEKVAWAMAFAPGDHKPSWVDVANLDAIQRMTQDGSAYAVYATGLLIPHGPVEPLGGTQQGARWLHRSLHENFVAQRLSQLIRSQADGWWTMLLEASTIPAWAGALSQTYSMLDEEGGAMTLLRRLESEIRETDTPCGHLAGIVHHFGVISRNAERRDRAAATLTAGGHWWLAAQVSAATTAEKVRSELSIGTRTFPDDFWVQLYREKGAADEASVIQQAWHVGCGGANLYWLFNWTLLESDAPGQRERALDRLCVSDTGMPWFAPPPLTAPSRQAVAGLLSNRLALTTVRPRLSMARAYEIWWRAAGDRDQRTPLPLERRLALAVRLGRKRDNIELDLRGLRSSMVEPLTTEDLTKWAGPLWQQGYSVPADEPEAELTLAALDGREVKDEELTPVSVALAVAIIEAADCEGWDFTWNRLETVSWAMSVLTKSPTADACWPLLRIREHMESPLHWVTQKVDSSDFIRALNSQPWDDLARDIRRTAVVPSPRDEGMTLCAAAGLRLTQIETNSRLTEDEAVAMYVRGMKKWATLPEENRPPIVLLDTVERVSPEKSRLFFAELSAAADGLPAGYRHDVLRLLEQVLDRSGLLGEFVAPLRTLMKQQA